MHIFSLVHSFIHILFAYTYFYIVPGLCNQFSTQNLLCLISFVIALHHRLTKLFMLSEAHFA